MNSKMVLIGAVLFFILGGVFFTISNSQNNTVSDTMMEGKGDVVQEESMVKRSDSTDKDSGMTQNGSGQYVTYNKSVYDAAADKKRIYFFHATWCPTCKAANTEFESSVDQIPSGVVVFKTDYDTNEELKKKYGITYQHTFVQVDSEGNEIAKWNGGGVAQLTANIK